MTVDTTKLCRAIAAKAVLPHGWRATHEFPGIICLTNPQWSIVVYATPDWSDPNTIDIARESIGPDKATLGDQEGLAYPTVEWTPCNDRNVQLWTEAVSKVLDQLEEGDLICTCGSWSDPEQGPPNVAHAPDCGLMINFGAVS